MRFELEMFAKAMEAKLQKHDAAKGDSWKTCNTSFLFSKLYEEFTEWGKSLKGAEYDRKELIDIANICMFLWYRDWIKSTKGTFIDTFININDDVLQ